MTVTADTAADFVEAYLAAMERRDLDAARAYLAEEVELVFPGGRRFTDIAEIPQNSATRYARVGKHIARRDVWQAGETVCVLITGTLHGNWPDGAPFMGIRFADRFDLLEGRIVRQEVWNDAAEHMLARRQEASQ